MLGSCLIVILFRSIIITDKKGGKVKKFFEKKSVRIVAIILCVALLIPLILELGLRISAGFTAWRPDYEKCDITPLLEKTELDGEDYELLYRQTGLTRIGIDGLLKEGFKARIFEIQNQFFEEQDYKMREFAPFTGYMRRTPPNDPASFCILENGDILYSPTTFFSFIRLGHTAIVIDAPTVYGGGYLAQASGYGTSIIKLTLDSFFIRPAFVVLRVNEDEETREAAASLVKEKLGTAEYGLFAGIFGDKAPEELEKTHCSHLVWYAWYMNGVDIDSNGGKIVTPKDILRSENLSVVQVYGIDPESLGEGRGNSKGFSNK